MGQMAHQALGLYMTASMKDTIRDITHRVQKKSPTSVNPPISGLSLESCIMEQNIIKPQSPCFRDRFLKRPGDDLNLDTGFNRGKTLFRGHIVVQNDLGLTRVEITAVRMRTGTVRPIRG